MTARRDEILASAEAMLVEMGDADGALEFMAEFFDDTVRAIRRDCGVPESLSPLPTESAAAARFGVERQSAGVPVTRIPSIFTAISQAVGKIGTRYELTIAAEEYKLLNGCLDAGIAISIENFWRRDRDRENTLITERFGFMAHELRNALGNAKMAFRLLREGQLGMKGHTSDVLARNLVRMEALVAQCLGGVQLEVSGTPALIPVSVANVLRDLEAGAIPERGVRLQMEADESLFIAADEMLLTSALSNLVHNAVKFSPADSTVSVEARLVGELVVIDVADQCGGLGEQVSAELFKPYVKRREGNPSGTGLGLSIAKRAVEAMGGSLSVSDHPGHGCVFSMAFPRLDR